jgi:hypothetical protein
MPAQAGVEKSLRHRSAVWPFSFWGVVSIGVAYGVVHSVLRQSISQNLPQDDVTSNILAQTFELGYTARQPPLYEWLVWSLQHLTGPNLLSFHLLKYSLLTGTLAFLYLAATRLFEEQKWAALAALSPLLLYQVGWTLHEGVTQTMVLMFAVSGSFWSFMRVVECGRVRDYLLFGAFIGLGLLSKYGFAGFAFALLAAACWQPILRARVLDRCMLLALATAFVVTTPFLYWLVTGGEDLVAVYGEAVAPHTGSRVIATLIGLGLAVFSPLAFLFPLDVLLPLCFPRMAREAWLALKCASTWKSSMQLAADWETLLLHLTLAGFLILLAGAILTGASHYLERYMHPFFLLTPLWLMAMAKRSRNREYQVKAFLTVLIGATVLALGVRIGALAHAMGPSCEKCRAAIPYQGLVASLQERGLHPGIIVTEQRHDAGNLRRFFPDAAIGCLERPSYLPPSARSHSPEKLVILWSRSDKDDRLPVGVTELAAKFGGRLDTTPVRIRVPWQPLWASVPRVWEWRMVMIDLSKPTAILASPSQPER